MQHFQKQANKLQIEFNESYDRIEIDSKLDKIVKIEKQLAEPDIWNDNVKAQELSKKLSQLQQTTKPWADLRTSIEDLVVLAGTGDETLLEDLEKQLEAAQKNYNDLKKELLFKGEYDEYNAILRLSAGVGGTDAQDWTEMLERMYLRWAEKSGMNTKVVDRSAGDEAGIKSCVVEVEGSFAYGKLRSENGVHRLVRLSPFNSDNLRQTSFALVEVLPQIDAPEEVVLDDKDLKIDVYRAGGHGGQSVNTTDSAVRVTHIPTDTVVAIQNERSQLQNKETALKVLRSKLVQLRHEQHVESISDLQAGESANWGSQIRNYVLHPYTLVKDTRTKYEEKDVQKVLDGNIQGFMQSYLEKNI